MCNANNYSKEQFFAIFFVINRFISVNKCFFFTNYPSFVNFGVIYLKSRNLCVAFNNSFHKNECNVNMLLQISRYYLAAQNSELLYVPDIKAIDMRFIRFGGSLRCTIVKLNGILSHQNYCILTLVYIINFRAITMIKTKKIKKYYFNKLINFFLLNKQ